MGAIRFPLILDIPSASSQVSSQEAARLESGAAGQPSVLQSDVVTLSALFPPAPAAGALNFVQFQNPQQPAVQAFPPPPRHANLALSERATGPTTRTTLTQQEQLAQLDRALEQLGISPQSISLDNRLALLRSANDPPALLNLVRALGVLGETATTGNNLSNPGHAGIPDQAQAQLPAQAEPQIQLSAQPTASPSGSSPPAGSGSETALQPNTGQSFPPPGTAAGSTSGLTGNAAAQFQEIQLIFRAAEGSQAASNTTSLNVLA